METTGSYNGLASFISRLRQFFRQQRMRLSPELRNAPVLNSQSLAVSTVRRILGDQGRDKLLSGQVPQELITTIALNLFRNRRKSAEREKQHQRLRGVESSEANSHGEDSVESLPNGDQRSAELRADAHVSIDQVMEALRGYRAEPPVGPLSTEAIDTDPKVRSEQVTAYLLHLHEWSDREIGDYLGLIERTARYRKTAMALVVQGWLEP